jgi:dTDP-4-amino-4,6-dideoxygalactose transaminase
MKYQFLDVKYTYQALSEEINRTILDLLKSGVYIGGNATEEFENEFANYCGAKYCIGVGNGYDALYLTLRAWDIGAGDEIIVPAHTFIATWLAASHVGAKLIPIDANPLSMNIDVDGIEKAISKKTKCIIPVHLYGMPVEMQKIKQIALDNKILLLEDAAQAHGAKYKNQVIGNLGDAAAFSFYPGKNLGAFGDGGAVVTNDLELAKKIRMLGNYGSHSKYFHDLAGVNSRLDPIQAVILRTKLRYLNEWNLHRQKIAAIYIDGLKNLDVISLPHIDDGMTPAWHLFVIRYKAREALCKELANRGVATGIHYPIPNNQSGAFASLFQKTSFPHAEEICNTCLSIPIGPHLRIKEAYEIVDHIKSSLLTLGH